MPVQKKKLKVLPNPWLYIDHKGRPAGRVAVQQPTNGTYDPRSVGSSIARAELVSPARKDVPLAQDVHDIEIEYVKEPVEVANTDYYRRRIMAGELIAADRDSFVAAGGRPKDFDDHQKHVEAKRAEAIAQFDLENGEGAFKALEQERKDAAELKAKMQKEAEDAARADAGDAPAVAHKADPKKGGAQ